MCTQVIARNSNSNETQWFGKSSDPSSETHGVIADLAIIEPTADVELAGDLAAVEQLQ